jgi:hypothetical protein
LTVDQILQQLTGGTLDGVPDWVTSLGLDAGTVGALNQATNMVKDDIKKWGLDGKLGRFYPILPIALGFGAFLLMGNDLATAGLDALKYGILANFTWAITKKTVQGA